MDVRGAGGVSDRVSMSANLLKPSLSYFTFGIHLSIKLNSLLAE